MRTLPDDYSERVYAGVLGKMIGVYLGRPFEGWTYERIARELGDIRYYVHDRRGVALRNTQLVITDDDLAGTFVFARALQDNDFRRDLTSRQIGETWLNYIIKGKTVLWWGGVGTSTEQTAFLRLSQGIAAPKSGSMALNGQVAAEQIGAQIFIDGWAMASPDDPALAAQLAGEAARVSHDGVAVHAAQLLAAMEAKAFVEHDMDRLLDTGLSFVPVDSLIRRVVEDVRRWHALDISKDWRSTRERIAAQYGYDRYAGNCHVVPNHALIILSLLYGQDRFDEALSISCTAGWDTDCNAGNVGCLMGIRGGLTSLDSGPDLRAPVADRIYLSSADAGSAITDAVQETWHLVEAGHRLAGLPVPARPKAGARFSFAFAGSVQGFHDAPSDPSLAHPGTIANVAAADGYALSIGYAALAPGRVCRATTPTFFDDEAFRMSYMLVACPTLYPGQRIKARVSAPSGNLGKVEVRLCLGHYDASDKIVGLQGPSVPLVPGGEAELHWTVPDLGGHPCYEVGIKIVADGPRADGAVLLHALDWSGAPSVELRRPEGGGRMWFHAWAHAADDFSHRWAAFRVSQGAGLGLVAQGARDWRNYAVESMLTPHMGATWGLLARVQGLRRWYGLLFDRAEGQGAGAGDRVRLVRMRHDMVTLASAPYVWEAEKPCAVRLEVRNRHLTASLDGRELFALDDLDPAGLDGGAIGLLCEEGSMSTDSITIQALASD